ncbi:MAG TPA: O-antigen ligase family protein [Edaphobacter sp.]|nr:O-antigen ligase family protein [Edaphobacter sp.]
MGLFLSLLYILTAYLGPQTIFGSLADYHIELIIATLAIIASIPAMSGSGIFTTPQSFALVGMSFTVFCSMAFNGLFGLSSLAMFDFIPNAIGFFLVAINFKKKSHLQMLIFVLLFASLFTIYRAYSALQANDLLSPYLLGQGNDEGSRILRIRGLSFISDPNDFSQLIVSLIPCLFFFWKKGKILLNTLVILVPSGILLFGMYLTHSRGAIVAFLAVVAISSRRKIGTLPATVLAGLLFVGMTALNWSGGRGISEQAGADRMAAWGTGLILIRTHPVFGVGYQRFTEYNDITAHNSIVVCAAELGVFGLFCWVLFLLPTIRGAVLTGVLAKKKSKDPDAPDAQNNDLKDLSLQPALATGRVNPYLQPHLQPHLKVQRTAAQPAPAPAPQTAAAPSPYFVTEVEQETLPIEELRRLSTLMVFCFTGYLTAAWFLSRAYAMTLFIYGGIAYVIYRAALRQGIAPPPLPLPRLFRLTAITCIVMLMLVYAILRAR